MRIRVIYASTSGHTEHVVGLLSDLWSGTGHTVIRIRAEQAEKSDLTDCDMLVLASGTWNTGGQEGNLNPHMHTLLFERIAEADLLGKPTALISLGDDRYYFTTRCTEHFMKFLTSANAKPLSPPLIIVNEPYDQEKRIKSWGATILSRL